MFVSILQLFLWNSCSKKSRGASPSAKFARVFYVRPERAEAQMGNNNYRGAARPPVVFETHPMECSEDAAPTKNPLLFSRKAGDDYDCMSSS